MDDYCVICWSGSKWEAGLNLIKFKRFLELLALGRILGLRRRERESDGRERK